jgi:FHA domain
VIDEPVVSNKHIRIYTVVYEKDKPTEISPLVYAEDLSRNGTFWNGSLIGKGNGGFLLSEGDTLRVSTKTYFTFQSCAEDVGKEIFDLVQEKEMKVSVQVSRHSPVENI